MPEEPIHFPSNDQKPNILVTIKCNQLLRFTVYGLVSIVLLAFAITSYISNLNQPPDGFPLNAPIVIEAGTDVRMITEILQEKGVVKSKQLLYYVLVLLHEPTNLKASTYIFKQPISTTEVASRLAEGDFDTDLIRFTHFEGERATQIAERANKMLINFDEERFLWSVDDQRLEGKLFPETYFLPSNFTDEELLILMTETFEAALEPLAKQISGHSLSLDEILVLASIIEREANSPASKALVSSVLQNRIEIGMALQADASIEYVLDKPLSELTPEDLKIDSPYNTYLYRGLPPTPIGNPGLDAIKSVLEPTASDYFYYITDEKGDFYFAETYREHLVNINKYLR